MGLGRGQVGASGLPSCPPALRSKCCIHGPGTSGASRDTAFLVPTPEGPGPGTPQASPAIREAGPRWVFINPQPSEGGARTYPSVSGKHGLPCRRAEGAGLGAPLGFTQPGDRGRCRASLDPSVSLKGRSVWTRRMWVCPWPRSAASLRAGQV